MALESAVRSIAGLLPVSMVDWDGKLASVLFIQGCNLSCPYCHNPDLVRAKSFDGISWESIEHQLREKLGWVDGVVITGGEPTISPDLREIISRIRELGLAVKLDTNGTRPEVLRGLLDDNLIDCVAMDVKTRFDGYDQATRVNGMAESVRASIDVIVSSDVDHEFRTTVAPGFVEPVDLIDIAQYLGERGAKRYFLQQFNPKSLLDADLESVRPFPLPVLEQSALACAEFVPTKLRGRA